MNLALSRELSRQGDAGSAEPHFSLWPVMVPLHLLCHRQPPLDSRLVAPLLLNCEPPNLECECTLSFPRSSSWVC